MTLQIGDLKSSYGGALALLWLDLETTGTNENADDIIEIGALLTDFDFNEIGTSFSIVIRPSHQALGRLMLEPTVREMHMSNGLLSDCINTRTTRAEAERELISWLDIQINRKRNRGPVQKFRFMLAGSGVGHFDRAFIKVQLPIFNDFLVYQPLDIGNVRRFLKMCNVGIQAPPNKDHRALDDIRQHLEEARRYQDLFQRVRDELGTITT